MVQLGSTRRRAGRERKQQRGAGLEEKKLPVRGKARLSNFCHPKKTDASQALLQSSGRNGALSAPGEHSQLA